MIKWISPALEDYLEAILMLESDKKMARVKDIANLLGVKAPSAIEAIASLAEKNMVIHERYGKIEFTAQGRQKAEKILKRHGALKKFFNRVLGVNDTVAEEDACKIEHYLSKETVRRMTKFMEQLERLPKKQRSLFSEFHRKK